MVDLHMPILYPGTIGECDFSNGGADGLDLSGSRASIRDVAMTRIGDKGVSAGEHSVVEIERLPGFVVQVEHDLKNWRCTGIPLGMQLIHEFLERQVLVRVRTQCGLLDPRQQFAETRIAA